MRKLLIAACAAALTGLALPALAQGDGDGPGRHGPGGMLFQSDANNDGVVTRAEFDTGRTALFARLDANSDGALTREEMRQGRHHGRRGHGDGERRGGFMGADADNNGSITREEFLARPIAMFDRMDKNGDGVISADERPQRPERGERAGRGGWHNPDANNDGRVTQAEFASAGAEMFARLDADNDGRITRAEAEAARPPRPGRD